VCYHAVMPASKNPPVADIDEDPNVEIRPYASPPCYAHEVDPAYFGLPARLEPCRLRDLETVLRQARALLGAAIDRIDSR
jgi:hypothetical protein